MRVALLGNPSSGRSRRATATHEATALLEEGGCEVLPVTGRTGQEVLEGLAPLMSGDRRPDAVVALGGDGTVHQALGAVAGTEVPLGIVAVGTGNDIARSLGLPSRDVASAVRIILEALRGEGRIAPLDAIRATRPGGEPVPAEHEWSLAVVSAGFDAAVNERANRLTWPHGEARYLRGVLEELGDLRPYGYRVTTDSGTWSGPALLLAAANTRYIGGGMDIVPHTDPTDGMLDLIRLDPVGRSRLLALLARLLRGTHLGRPGISLERTSAVVIEALEETPERRRPPHPMADGERVAGLPLRLEAVRGAVRVLVRG